MRVARVCLLILGLSGVAVPSARANLVTNGDFATGTFAGWTNPVDFSVVIDSSFAPPGDSYDAAFTRSGTLSQNIATVAGQAYTLSFSLLNEAGFFLDSFLVTFGGFSASFTGDLVSTYLTETLSITAADIIAANTVLTFEGSNPSGQNWNLADVSVVSTAVTVPEPSSGLIAAAGALSLLLFRPVRKSQG